MVTYGASSFKMKLLTFVLNVCNPSIPKYASECTRESDFKFPEYL